MPSEGREKFAVLKRPQRIWAVAAIHGEAERLKRLHDGLAAELAPGDRLVYLGNYLGRGADVRGAVDELLAFRRAVIARPRAFASDVAYLRGSQEEMWHKLLQLQFAPNPREVLEWMLDQGVGMTLAAYGGSVDQARAAARSGPLAITRWTTGLRTAVNAAPGHVPFAAAWRRAAYSDDGRLLFVHAGIDPARPLTAQSDSFWWGGDPFLDLAEPYAGYRRIVRGFDRRRRGVAEGPYAVSIDAGCGFGGPLLAICLDPEGNILKTAQA